MKEKLKFKDEGNEYHKEIKHEQTLVQVAKQVANYIQTEGFRITNALVVPDERFLKRDKDGQVIKKGAQKMNAILERVKKKHNINLDADKVLSRALENIYKENNSEFPGSNLEDKYSELFIKELEVEIQNDKVNVREIVKERMIILKKMNMDMEEINSEVERLISKYSK